MNAAQFSVSKHGRSVVLLASSSSLQVKIDTLFKDKSLRDVELFASGTIAGALDIIIKNKPFLIIVDVSADCLDNIAIFFQKIRTNVNSAAAAIIVLCTSEVQTRLLHMGGEYAINDILLIESVAGALGSMILSVLEESKKPSAMKALVNRIEQAGAKNSLGELDMATLDFYTLFPKERRACVEFANYCIRRGDWPKAKEVLDKVIKKDPNDLRAINSMVRVLLREHDVDNAVVWLNKAEILSPSNVSRMVLLGDVYREKGITDIAKAKYGQALEIIPECRDAKQGLAIVSLSAGEVSDALRLFSESSSQEEIASYFNDAAIISVHKTKFTQAQQLYNAALGALNNPKIRAKVIFNMGLAYNKERVPDKAIEYFTKAANEDPDYSRPRNALLRMGINVPLEGEISGNFKDAAEVTSAFLEDLKAAAAFEDAAKGENNGTKIETRARAPGSEPKIIAQKDKSKDWSHWSPDIIAADNDMQEEDFDKPTSIVAPIEAPGVGVKPKKEEEKKKAAAKPKFLDDEEK